MAIQIQHIYQLLGIKSEERIDGEICHVPIFAYFKNNAMLLGVGTETTTMIFKVVSQLPELIELFVTHPRLSFYGFGVDSITNWLIPKFRLTTIKKIKTTQFKQMMRDKGISEEMLIHLNRASNLLLGKEIPGNLFQFMDSNTITKELLIYISSSVKAQTEISKLLQNPNFDSNELPNNSDGILTRVLLDIFHFFDRLKLPANHFYLYIFSKDFRDCIFDFVPEVKEKVSNYLKLNNMDFKTEYEKRSKWILRHCPRTIPKPEVLVVRLNSLLEKYTTKYEDGSMLYTDPSTSKPLFSPSSIEEFKKLLVHVQKGCISDPIGINLYYEICINQKTGLMMYRCIRGTSDIEGGVHQKLIKNCSFWNCSVRLLDAHLANFRNRHNIRSAIKHRMGFPNIGHYSHDLIDILIEETVKLYGRSLYSWWSNTYGKKIGIQTFGVGAIHSEEVI